MTPVQERRKLLQHEHKLDNKVQNLASIVYCCVKKIDSAALKDCERLKVLSISRDLPQLLKTHMTSQQGGTCRRDALIESSPLHSHSELLAIAEENSFVQETRNGSGTFLSCNPTQEKAYVGRDRGRQ